jgi:hypothetical protein
VTTNHPRWSLQVHQELLLQKTFTLRQIVQFQQISYYLKQIFIVNPD